jgi:single-stranded DNA-binding protein
MNIIVLTGRLLTLPEVKISKSNKQYATASIVVQDSMDAYPMFVDIVVFERNLQALQGTKKGGFIQVQGKLNIYNPKDQAGQTRSGKQVKVTVDNIIIPAERMTTNPESGNTGNGGSYQPQPGRNGGTAPVAVATPPETDFDPFEE